MCSVYTPEISYGTAADLTLIPSWTGAVFCFLVWIRSLTVVRICHKFLESVNLKMEMVIGKRFLSMAKDVDSVGRESVPQPPALSQTRLTSNDGLFKFLCRHLTNGRNSVDLLSALMIGCGCANYTLRHPARGDWFLSPRCRHDWRTARTYSPESSIAA